jgi:CheY-like chemotaxis protein
MNAQQKIRVLIADDDENILECYQDALAPILEGHDDLRDLEEELFEDTEVDSDLDSQFEVVSCLQGEQAAEIAASAIHAGTPFDVVILDIRMPPGINGVETAQRIRELTPDVPIIFVTGYSDMTLGELKAQVPPGDQTLCMTKPIVFYSLPELLLTTVSPS